MSKFIIGQRWISYAETYLGLGTVVDIEGRQIRLHFPAVSEERLYAMHSAPLARIEYKPGETIRTESKKTLQVLKVDLDHGRLLYHAKDAEGNEIKVDELELYSSIELSSPKQRLISGQLEPLHAYQLRCETLQRLHHLQQSSVCGLLGSRTSLLPHQIYIAHEVARRYAPRVLLADEPGLGKTIEAGMILHYQLHTGLANRILIIVPETLTHQWLVEILRRFNRRFALFNKDRLDALKGQGNPFESEQLIICSLDNLTCEPELYNNALLADWDLIVVDEAHHLHSDEGDVGHGYRCIESLAEKCRGLLLLTATPEQAGTASHFARLRLLDPARFHDLDGFLKEEQGYQKLSDTVRVLLAPSDEPLSPEMLKQLRIYLDDDVITNELDQKAREAIISKLLDRHGTGRVFLRNTRKAIKGFPKRKLISYPLTSPKLYSSLSKRQTLFPEMELATDDWLKNDPRVPWLIELLNQLKPQKVLVICANKKTAMGLEKNLQLYVGIRSAVFYEGLSIIERDRAAAYFADDDLGAQVLICSEIGSEGRNFQFSHHLVLFDLPLDPNLLEQRIGRLDRIGQTEIINIHVPYIESSAQDILFNWYNEGLNIFTESCAAAYAIYEKFEPLLNEILDQEKSDITALIDATSKHTKKIKQAMHDGRDRLIELNSCRKDIAKNIIDAINKEEIPKLLMGYMEQIFNAYGVDYEEHSEDTWILHPGEHMRIGYFPELSHNESITVTFNRAKALHREELLFISWEHPMVSEAMEMVLHSELGKASISTIKRDGIKPSTIMLETFASISAIAPKELQIHRYLPLTPLRTFFDNDRKSYAKALSHKKLNSLSQKVDQQVAYAIIKQIRADIKTMIDFAMKFTESKLPVVREEAQKKASTLLTVEIERLQQLRKKNTAIRQEEIEFLEEQRHACTEIIGNATYELQAVRLIIAQ